MSSTGRWTRRSPTRWQMNSQAMLPSAAWTPAQNLSLEEWHRAYPEATLHAVPELRAKRQKLSWGSNLSDTPAAEWSNDIDQVVIRGNRITTEVVFFHRRSRTAIF